MLPKDLQFHLQNIRSTLDGVLHFAKRGTLTSAQTTAVEDSLSQLMTNLETATASESPLDSVDVAMRDLRQNLTCLTGLSMVHSALLRFDPDLLLDFDGAKKYSIAIGLTQAAMDEVARGALQTGECVSEQDNSRNAVGEVSALALRSRKVYEAVDVLGARRPLPMAQARFGTLSSLILLTDELMGREENAKIAAVSRWTSNPTESFEERAAHKRNLLDHLKSRAESSA